MASSTRGMLKVTTSTTNGTDYALNVGTLSVNNGFTGTLTSTATFSDEVQTREIDFIYDHNGMRTAKIVSENGRVETTEYTLHGKLITHMTKRTVDENGAESTEELHFFYDAQSRPAKVDYNGVIYTYVHNLQSDIVGVLDSSGTLVIEYKCDAWGKPLRITGTLKSKLGELNPFRYRGYVWDAETELYYLYSRYYLPEQGRFVNCDLLLDIWGELSRSNGFCYCMNNSVNNHDESGNISFQSLVPPSESGFIPPRGGAQRLHSDFGYGWKDTYGNIWVPRTDGHAGNHWDVYRRDGKGYINVYPNGHRRGGSGKEPNLPPTSPQPNASPAPTTTPSSPKIVTVPTPAVLPTPNPTPAPLIRPGNLPETGTSQRKRIPTWVCVVVTAGAAAAAICLFGTAGVIIIAL